MSQVAALLDEMHSRFNADAAAGMENTFQYNIEDEGSWLIVIQNDTCTVTEGESDEVDVTLSMSLDTLRDVINGEVEGMDAFMSGDLQAEGDAMLATRLTDLFPQG